MTERVEVAAPQRFFWSDIVKIPFAVVLAILMQLSWDRMLPVVRVDFVTLFILFLALWRDDTVAAISGFGAGIVLSFVTDEPLGITSAALVLVAYVMGYIGRKISLENAAVLFLAVLGVLVFQDLLLRTFSLFLGVRTQVGNVAWCILTALLLLVLLPMLRKIFPRTRSIDVHVADVVSET